MLVLHFTSSLYTLIMSFLTFYLEDSSIQTSSNLTSILDALNNTEQVSEKPPPISEVEKHCACLYISEKNDCTM